MKRQLLIMLALLLPLMAAAQSAEEYYKKGEESFQQKDYQTALKWYQKAAKQGYALAQNALGDIYLNGYGVNKHYRDAFKWYQKAANQGYARAQAKLGVMYFVTQKYAKAAEWYQKAVDQGDAFAQCNLGALYQSGMGVTKDYVKAVELFQKAADQGNVGAQYNLGWMYHKGLGVSQNDVKAIEWYQKAADQGNENAKDNLARLQKEIAKRKDVPTQMLTAALPDEQSKQPIKQEQKPVAQAKSVEQIKPVEETKPVVEQVVPVVEIEPVDTNIPVLGRVNKNTFAIIIANEDYQEETKVDYALNDGKVFKEYCHKTLGLPEKNVHFMPNATLNNLIGQLDWLSQVCDAYGGEASVIFYYAGHGLPDEDSGSAYLLPTDGNSRLLRTCFSINELYATLGALPAKKVTVLMDACFSGAKRNGDMLTAARGAARKVKASVPMGSMVVLSAARGSETAYKYEDAHHGLFTYFLLKKLKDSKGNVRLGELSRYLQTEVKRYSIVENGKSQTPTVQTSDKLRNSWQDITLH